LKNSIYNKGENMYENLIKHEKYILKILNFKRTENLDEIIEYHLNQISLFQHERMAHLIVTMSVGIILSVILSAAIIYGDSILYLLTLVIVIIELFYIIHYYKMENGVQRLYKLYNQLKEKEGKILKI